VFRLLLRQLWASFWQQRKPRVQELPEEEASMCSLLYPLGPVPKKLDNSILGLNMSYSRKIGMN